MNSSGRYYAHGFWRSFLRFLGRFFYCQKIKRNKDTRVLVILHLFYMSAWAEIREYLKCLSSYNYSLIVTCSNGYYDESTLSQVLSFKKDARIIRCENLGWDVLPFLVALRTINLKDFDIVFKLQSKGTKRREIFLYGQYFRKRDWFLNLFNGCIGPFTVHRTIDDLMDEDKGIGLVAAKNLIVEDPIHKRHMVEQTLDELGLPKPKDYKFVAGSCFAIRASLMDRISNLDIDVEEFNSSGFSYAHRMERIICFPPLWNGLRMKGPNVNILRRSLWVFHTYAWWWRKYNGARMLKDPRVHVDDVFAFRCIEPVLIKDWEFVDIPVGEIRRQLYPNDKTYVSLSETLPYKYLVNRDPEIYKEYCEYNRQIWKNGYMSQKRFDQLISSLETKGDTKENNIVINQDNLIYDGQHRCCWLLYTHGPEFVVNALQVNEYYPSLLSRSIRVSLDWARTVCYRIIVSPLKAVIKLKN